MTCIVTFSRKYSLLACVDEITVEYWSTLAERRQFALKEALEENEKLHRQVDELKTEVESLKTENELLKPMAEEAEYLAGVLKVIFEYSIVMSCTYIKSNQCPLNH